ncbi:adenylate/guanylate cyclase domain-containing protein [Fulvivirga sp. M361]|uniref:adenylate/guanylate cyclase domain-containing protein n=1 Tax=Fulvivirga sp. M361 TaxID=2594266 RepID=UPI001179F251|nr:adenylate/guanylate cyclase domain-containing protein [Fulvivirga sp. M361]TRX52680.1 adenylate/guanylate cyclase domain-containing protein [Fulvivirga sp. M361]
MSRRFLIQLKKILVIIALWLIIGFLVTVYDYFSLISDFSKGPVDDFSFTRTLLFNLIAAFMGSAMGAPFLVFYVNEKLRDRPYGYTLLAVAVSFVVIVTVITIILGWWLVKQMTGNWPYASSLATEQFYDYLINPLHVKNIILWSMITLLTQFLLQINDKFGHGLLWDFLRGKYNKPQDEVRVFMFLDLMDSTAIAERLGNKNYYNLLRDFYADITNDIIYNAGEIYQYVGDEVVISWKYDKGVQDHHCIRCFFDIRSKISSLEDKYRAKYGIVPDFKAALHYGHVMAGEIGIIKKDITYSGDVLNTTSRILSMCNAYKKRLIISGNLFRSLQELESSFDSDRIGEEYLRGKKEKVELYAISPLL